MSLLSLPPNISQPRSFLKPVAGIAIAASVAAIAILGLQQNQSKQISQPNQQLVARQPEVSTGSTQFTAQPRTVSVQAWRPELRNTGANSRLSSYLLNYNEYRTTHTGMQGILPYVRIITYENDK